jgi:dipeptidyl aminopeptidase/acylaminoacyl peptidase
MALREWLITCKIFTQRRKGAKKQKSFFLSLPDIETGMPILLIGWVLLITAQNSLAQSPRGMTPADTLRVANVAEAQIAPDGNTVCYTVSTTEGNATRSALWCAPLGAERTIPPPPRAAPQQVLGGDWNVSRPRWSPDGRRLAFLASRGEQSGLWVMSPRERQPRFVVAVRSTNYHLPYAGESFAWSPDSRRLAYINATEEAQDNAATSGATGDARAARRDDPRIVDRIQYKSRTSFSDTLRTHVWLTDVDEPAPRQLTSGPHYDHALTWNPRGEEIAFLSNHEADPEAVNNSDIFAVTLDGRTRQLTSTRGCEYEPAWSPDGKWLAYTATTRDVTTIDSVAEDTHVWIIDAAGGKARELTAEQDRRARSPRWTADSRRIFFLANDRGQTLIYTVAANGGRVRALFNDAEMPLSLSAKEPATSARVLYPNFLFQISSISLQRAASIDSCAFILSSPLNPAEVWMLRMDATSGAGAPPRRISSHNAEFARSFTFVNPEGINFKSFDGTNVQGWLMKPLNFRESERYPLILSIHGGPHGMYGYGFNAAFQTYAARGYGVLFINPRGSTGYGQKFSDGTLREWGGGDYRDLMAGVDEALRRFPWIDRGRMGVTGGSYGGFMTNWIITQTPRFRAAVASASVSNLVSFYSTSLYQDLIHAEFGGFPWDDYDLLWRWSPLRYVRAVETPTLFIHGELDNDVHITQAEEMYMALKRRGVETVLARYPREGHGFREPRHREDALERTIAWFDKYLK